MYRWELLQYLIEEYNLKTYLEIGTGRYGTTFNKIKISYKVGIDRTKTEKDIPGIKHITSEEFFYNCRDTFDIVFVDGFHTFEQSLCDTLNALQHLNKNGFIVLHDTNPPNEAVAGKKPTAGAWNGDVWRSIVYLRVFDKDIFVVDTDEGCGVLRKKDIRWDGHSVNEQLVADINTLPFSYLNNRRVDILNLIDIDNFLSTVQNKTYAKL